MGFLDKAKENIEKVAKQGQDKLDEVQSKKKADGLLRDLGAWTYAASTGRDNGQGPGEVERISAELHAHEAEHGPLGGDQPANEGPGKPAATGPASPTSTPGPAPSAPPPPMAPVDVVPPIEVVPPVDVVPPQPPIAEEAPVGAVPPPPTFAPIPPPVDVPQPEGGPKLDEL
ncbi:MAG: hypothetical protein M3Z46_04125 [Actinomycetota bacterium]|nr:hypothetical protein [Actinomycetota bacterium]